MSKLINKIKLNCRRDIIFYNKYNKKNNLTQNKVNKVNNKLLLKN